MGKEKFWIRILRKLGIIEQREVSREEMCKRASKVCNHNCNSCAWKSE